MPSVHESQENEAVVVMLHETIQSWSLPDKAKSSLSCQNIDRVKHLFSTDKRMDIPSLDKRRFCGHCMIFQNILRRHCSQEDNLILKDFCRSFSCQEPRLFLVEFSIMLCVESLSLKCSFAPLLCSFFFDIAVLLLCSRQRIVGVLNRDQKKYEWDELHETSVQNSLYWKSPPKCYKEPAWIDLNLSLWEGKIKLHTAEITVFLFSISAKIHAKLHDLNLRSLRNQSSSRKPDEPAHNTSASLAQNETIFANVMIFLFQNSGHTNATHKDEFELKRVKTAGVQWFFIVSSQSTYMNDRDGKADIADKINNSATANRMHWK